MNSALFYDLFQTTKFKNQLLGLPLEVRPQILEKIETLKIDPTPNAKSKKKLQHIDDRIESDQVIIGSFIPFTDKGMSRCSAWTIEGGLQETVKLWQIR